MKLRDIKMFWDKRGPGVATAGAIILAVAGVVNAIRKSRETAKIIDEYEFKAVDCDDKKDEVKLKVSTAAQIAVEQKEAIACAVGSGFCAWYAFHKQNGTIGALLAAVALNEDKLAKVYSKAEEIFGKNGGKDLREAVDCDIAPFDTDDIVKTKKHYKKEDAIEGFFESYSGVPFESSSRNVENAITLGERRSANSNKSLGFDKWMSLLGLDCPPSAAGAGWAKEFPFKPYTEVVEIDGREFIGIFYENQPRHDYVNYLFNRR